jgi:NitT/TauT family transport system substrate-binding protein
LPACAASTAWRAGIGAAWPRRAPPPPGRRTISRRWHRPAREIGDSDPAALKVYADWLKISVEKAKRTRDGFFPRSAIEPDKITGLDSIVKDTVSFKYTPKELTKEQIAELVQIPAK